ncbi:MAG: recombinase family protein [Clostridiales bacterium]|nr:recombinase family protein [Clostridiales bacterium]
MGYARVSSTGQNLDRQINALKKYVPEENIVTDKVSGKNLERPGYQALKGPLGLRRGDSLVICSLDRLSRSKADIKSELIWFRENGIRLMVLDLPTTVMELPEEQNWIQEMVNNVMLEVLSSMAEQERLAIRQRQREGIDAAKKAGKHLGRPRIEKPENWEAVYEKWRSGEITARQAMALCGIKKGTFYAMVKIYGKY